MPPRGRRPCVSEKASVCFPARSAAGRKTACAPVPRRRRRSRLLELLLRPSRPFGSRKPCIADCGTACSRGCPRLECSICRRRGVPYIVSLSLPGLRSETLLHFRSAAFMYRAAPRARRGKGARSSPRWDCPPVKSTPRCGSAFPGTIPSKRWTGWRKRSGSRIIPLSAGPEPSVTPDTGCGSTRPDPKRRYLG